MLGDLQNAIYGIGAAVVVSLLFVAGNAMAMAMRERTTEVAVLKAIGFSKGLVLFLVLTEAILVAGLGGALGSLGCKALCDVVDVAKYSAGFLPVFFVPWRIALLGLARLALRRLRQRRRPRDHGGQFVRDQRPEESRLNSRLPSNHETPPLHLSQRPAEPRPVDPDDRLDGDLPVPDDDPAGILRHQPRRRRDLADLQPDRHDERQRVRRAWSPSPSSARSPSWTASWRRHRSAGTAASTTTRSCRSPSSPSMPTPSSPSWPSSTSRPTSSRTSRTTRTAA